MDTKSVKRDYFLQLCKKFTANLDSVIIPVVKNAENQMRKTADAGKRISIRTQTDINDFINSNSNPTASATAGFFDFLVVTCPPESRDYLQNLRYDTENLIEMTSHLIGKYKEILPVINTMVPGTEEQIDLVRDARYCLKYMDGRMKSDASDWFKYEKKFVKQPDDTDSSEEDIGKEEMDKEVTESVNTNTKKASNFRDEFLRETADNSKSTTAFNSNISGDADVNMTDTLAKQVNAAQVNNLDVSTSSDLNDKDGDTESDTDNCVVKQCTHDGCDYSTDTDSKLSFLKHFLTYHPGDKRPDKWVIKDISTSDYEARKAKWNTLSAV
uniref:Uncharacterized protein n=1 Tax=Tetranychus urticae TaxID=32264 RepID=T1KWT4_TETUR